MPAAQIPTLTSRYRITNIAVVDTPNPQPGQPSIVKVQVTGMPASPSNDPASQTAQNWQFEDAETARKTFDVNDVVEATTTFTKVEAAPA